MDLIDPNTIISEGLGSLRVLQTVRHDLVIGQQQTVF